MTGSGVTGAGRLPLVSVCSRSGTARQRSVRPSTACSARRSPTSRCSSSTTGRPTTRRPCWPASTTSACGSAAIRSAAGLTASLNAGVEMATSGLIARMDADDIAYPDRLALEFGLFRASPQVGLVADRVRGRRRRRRRVALRRRAARSRVGGAVVVVRVLSRAPDGDVPARRLPTRRRLPGVGVPGRRLRPLVADGRRHAGRDGVRPRSSRIVRRAPASPPSMPTECATGRSSLRPAPSSAPPPEAPVAAHRRGSDRSRSAARMRRLRRGVGRRAPRLQGGAASVPCSQRAARRTASPTSASAACGAECASREGAWCRACLARLAIRHPMLAARLAARRLRRASLV